MKNAIFVSFFLLTLPALANSESILQFLNKDSGVNIVVRRSKLPPFKQYLEITFGIELGSSLRTIKVENASQTKTNLENALKSGKSIILESNYDNSDCGLKIRDKIDAVAGGPKHENIVYSDRIGKCKIKATTIRNLGQLSENKLPSCDLRYEWSDGDVRSGQVKELYIYDQTSVLRLFASKNPGEIAAKLAEFKKDQVSVSKPGPCAISNVGINTQLGHLYDQRVAESLKKLTSQDIRNIKIYLIAAGICEDDKLQTNSSTSTR